MTDRELLERAIWLFDQPLHPREYSDDFRTFIYGLNAHLNEPVQDEPLFLVMAGGDAFQSDIVQLSKLDDAYLLTQWGALHDISPDERADALANFHDDDSWTHEQPTGFGERVKFSESFEDGWVEVIRLPSIVALNTRPSQNEHKALAEAIHYPDCWDTAAYPTLADALSEVAHSFRCTNQDTHTQDERKALAKTECQRRAYAYADMRLMASRGRATEAEVAESQSALDTAIDRLAAR